MKNSNSRLNVRFNQKAMIYFLAIFITAYINKEKFTVHITTQFHIQIAGTTNVGLGWEKEGFSGPAHPIRRHRKTLNPISCDTEKEKRTNEKVVLTPAPPLPANQPSSSANPVAFWKLALQHPNAFCSSIEGGCVDDIPESLTIHGLYGMSSNRVTQPKYNKRKREKVFLPENSISFELTEKLSSAWPQLGSGGGLEFWIRVYKAHGVQTGLTPMEYFLKALQLKAKVDFETAGGVTNVLSRANVQMGQSYSPSQFCDPLKEAINVVPFLKCNTNRTHTNQLLEVQVCADLMLNLVDCSIESSCLAFGCSSDNILYASKPHVPPLVPSSS